MQRDGAAEGMITLSLGFGTLAAVLALAGAATALLGARAVRRFAAMAPAAAPAIGPSTGPALAASVLRPLHGAAPGLAAALDSTARQDHAAAFEVLCAVRNPADPAATVAERVLGPEAVIRDPRVHGPNLKASQLVNLAARARHPVLVVVDDDIVAPPHWLTAVTAPLADPAVGLVTCLYRGEAEGAGLWSRLGGLGLDWGFLPNAILGESLGRAKGCYGATMALRAETLARLGGFQALVDLLADDHALGAKVRRLGLRVVVAPVVPAHLMAEPRLVDLLRHELRWARTVRLLDPPGYAGMIATFPLPFGALAAALLPAAAGLPVLALALAARLLLAITVDRALLRRRLAPGRFALLPVRDGLGFLIWAAGLARGTVVWQGRRYRMDPEGRMAETGRKGFSTR